MRNDAPAAIGVAHVKVLRAAVKATAAITPIAIETAAVTLDGRTCRLPASHIRHIIKVLLQRAHLFALLLL